MLPLTVDAAWDSTVDGLDGDGAVVRDEPTWEEPSTPTLDARLEASGRGDALAFESLYEEVAPLIHGLVSRIVQDLRQADAVTQEIFLEIWRTSARFDRRQRPALSWVMTLAHRKAVAHVRSARHGRPLLTSHFDSPVTAASGPTPTTPPRHDGMRPDVLSALSATQRSAVELTYYSGFAPREVAEFLEVPLAAAKMSVRDGMNHLRQARAPMGTRPA